MDVRKGSYAMEAQKIVSIRCWVSSTTMIPRTRKEKFPHRGSMESVQRYVRIKDCIDLLLGINHHIDF